MKIQVKIICIALTLGILWLFGLIAQKDAFAVNQVSFEMTFQNGGDAASWIDYVIYEDTTSPYSQYNSGDHWYSYTGASPDLGFGKWVSVPANSSVNINRGPFYDFPTGGALRVDWLPWKEQISDPRDYRCEDPHSDLTLKNTTVYGANDIHFIPAGYQRLRLL